VRAGYSIGVRATLAYRSGRAQFAVLPTSRAIGAGSSQLEFFECLWLQSPYLRPNQCEPSKLLVRLLMREWRIELSISQRDLTRLKTLAMSGDTSAEFVEFAEQLLLSDFAFVFEFLKNQKLLIKSRDVLVVRAVTEDLRVWLRSAPLSGKLKAKLRRHLNVSLRIQDLFSQIDHDAKDLQIWNCGKQGLALTVLDSVEQCYDVCISEARGRNWEELDVWEMLDSSRSLSTTLRNYCDVALIVLSQLALHCPQSGIAFDHVEDFKRAIGLASRFDELSVMFDHYSFTRWRAAVTASDIRFHPAFDDYDRARQWCAQRTEASDHSLRDLVSIEYWRIQKLVKNRLAPEQISDKFEDFLNSALGRTVRAEGRSTRELLSKFLREKVSGMFDMDSEMRTNAGRFKIWELLDGWAAVYLLSTCARIWNDIRSVDGKFRGGDTGRVPTMRFVSFDEFLRSEIGYSEEMASSFRRQFTSDLEDRSSLDLFYRPLLRISQDEFALAISYAETSRFDRNVFRIALLESDMDLAKRGFKPLKAVVARLREKDFKSTENVPLSADGRIRTDADLLAFKDGLLFVAQVKIVIDADSVYETWQVEQKLRTAASQLVRTLALLDEAENLRRAVQELGLSGPGIIEGVVSFILTNDWHFTGLRIDGFSVVDLSYLELIFTEGAMTFGTRGRPVRVKFIRGEKPTGEELRTLIENPLHRMMFTKPEVEFLTRPVGKLSYSVPVTRIANA
jgi:hypothetical protein